MYWFLGGDDRSRWAVEYLRKKGLNLHCCQVPGFPNEALPPYIPRLILPVPSFTEGKIPGCESLSGTVLLSKLDSHSRVYCVNAGSFVPEARALGVAVTDLYGTEPYSTRNALATAEGALLLALKHAPQTLSGSDCLVIGAGRIGTLLAEKLSALGAKVTLCGRKAKDRALAEARGLKADVTGVYERGLCHYDFLFNTVPAPILSEAQLPLLKKDCLLMELASAPGGFDPAVCKALGLEFLLATGLPGKYSPKTAGICYAMGILEKEGIL